MRFLVDMPLPRELAAWLIQNGHEAVHASELGLHDVPDATILERARKDQRVVVTADLDYPRLLVLTQERGPGLILFRGGNFSEAESVERLRRALEAVAAHELPHSIIVIEKDRVRRRRLPIERNQ